MTQIYDHALEPSGLTVSQFGLLAYLLGASRAPSNASSMGTIAEWLGMDPTTLNRNLKPLTAKGLVRNAPEFGRRSGPRCADYRGRTASPTKGRAVLAGRTSAGR